MIGIAFSVGFIIGPMIGALFARSAGASGGAFFVQPALFALLLAVSDVLYIFLYFQETLPPAKRVSQSTLY